MSAMTTTAAAAAATTSAAAMSMTDDSTCKISVRIPVVEMYTSVKFRLSSLFSASHSNSHIDVMELVYDRCM